MRRHCGALAIYATIGLLGGCLSTDLLGKRQETTRQTTTQSSNLADPQQLLLVGEDLVLQGNWLGARPYFKSAEAAFNTTHDERDRLYAQINFLRADLEYSNLSVQAVAQSEEQLAANPLVRRDSALLLRTLAIQAECTFSFDPARSEAAWHQVSEIASQRRDDLWVNRASGELAFFEFNRGNIFRAMALVGEAIAKARLYRDVGAQIRYETALAVGLFNAHKFSYALYFSQAAIDHGTSNRGSAIPFVALLTHAESLFELGHSKDGVAQLRTLLADSIKRNLQLRQVQALVALGEYFVSHGEFTGEALEDCHNANALASRLGLRREVASSAAMLAKYYLAKGSLASAESYANEAVREAHDTADSYDLPEYLSTLAAVEAQKGKTDAADATYVEAFTMVDHLLARLPTIDARNTIISAETPLYTAYVRFVLEKQHKPRKALSLVEYVRARSINDFLQSRQADTVQRADDLDTRMEALNRSLANRTNGQISPPDKQSIAFDDRGMTETSVVLQSAIQQVLQPSEVIVMYLLAAPNSYAITITRSAVGVIELQSAATITKSVTALLAKVYARQPCNELESEVYRELLAPVLPALQKKDLIIIPDGRLNNLPFELLVDPTTGHYAVETHSVSYAASANALYSSRTRKSNQPQPSAVLAVGGVSYGLELRATRSLARRTQAERLWSGDSFAFSELFASIDEALTASHLVGGANDLVLSGQNATEVRLKALPLERFGVLHFATHTVVDDLFPEHSALVLGDTDSSWEDGLWEVHEISRLRLNARLVTLAACSSAVGRGEGLGAYGSLAEAFLTAGAHSVLATDWGVQDSATSHFVSLFYRYLAAGNTASDALRLAKLDVIHEEGVMAQPYYWAGFRLIGDGSERIDSRRDGRNALPLLSESRPREGNSQAAF